MPERALLRSSLIDEVQKGVLGVWRGEYPGHSEWEIIEGICSSKGVTLLGFGHHRIVLNHPNDTNKIMAFEYQNISPWKALERYYFTNILASLFPHNFPKMYAVQSGESSMFAPGHISEKLYADSTLNAPNFTFLRTVELPSPLYYLHSLFTNRHRICYPFVHARRKCNELGIPLSIDANPDNFIVAGGGEYYVEPVDFYWHQQSLDIEKIMAHMRKKSYQNCDIQRTSRLCARLNSIHAGVKNKAETGGSGT